LIKIDPRDYELAARQAKAAVAEAQVNLELERGEAEVARREWQRLEGGAEPPSPLVFRGPQIRQAEAKLKSAEAALARAQLDLERTELSLPIDVFIVEQDVDLGQFVSGGQAVGSAYGTGSMEIEVPLEDRELAWFGIGNGGMREEPNHASNAVVTAKLAGGEYSWNGKVVRTTGRIDDTTRLISVVVEVQDPFSSYGGRPFLLPGTFVEVAIAGSVVEDIVVLPRTAVRGRDEVWVCKDGRLHTRKIKIARAERDVVYVAEGLAETEMVVTTSLDVVTEGMAVRAAVEDKSLGQAPVNVSIEADRP
jgi:RND family efflux transporter MFP subunit